MVGVADIVRCPQGALVVVDGVVLSAWTEAYDRDAVALLERCVQQAARGGSLAALGIYRLSKLREMPDAETRAALAAVGKAYPFKVMTTVLDSSGFGNALIRLFLGGLMGLLPKDSPMAVASSVDEGLAQLATAGFDTEALRPALELLVAEVFGTPERVLA